MRYLILILALFSCSPEVRLKRLIDRHPEFVKSDTVIVHDTTFIPGSKKDTLFSSSSDTVYLKDGKTIVKYFYNTTEKTNYLSSETKPDTIIKVVKVPVDRVTYVNDYTYLWYIFIGIIILIVIILILRLLR